MEEQNKTYVDILMEVINGTTNEDKVAEVFSADLNNEEVEKSLKALMDGLYEAYNDAESQEQKDGIITQYVEEFKALNKDKDKDEKKAEPQPKLQTDAKGSYVGFFLPPLNHLQRITDVLTKMAETDEELANAIKEGKKTFEGCDRFIRNNMKDIAREMKANGEVVYADDTVHMIARWYMVNPDACDVQNAVSAVKNTKKAEPKKVEKKEPKPKKEKKTKVIPLTPQMGSLFGDDDFE